MITRPTHDEITETVRAELLGVVMSELTSDHARSVVRLAEQLLRDTSTSVE